MHHMYSSKKGDPLCPLGFHPQVRWPTRCKRCFRDYKEHGGKKDSLRDITSSTPSLSFEQSSGRSAENGKRVWSSATNLAKDDFKGNSDSHAAAGWTSFMDLSTIDKEEERFEAKRPTKLRIKEVIDNSNESTSKNDVEFIIQVKKTRSGSSKNGTQSVNHRPEEEETSQKSEVDRLRTQLSELQARCERAEKEKSEILMRRLTTMENISSKASTNELQKLQKKNEALAQERTSLLTKIRELEKEVNLKSFRGERDREKEEIRSKLKAAENLCENLMDENEDMKKEIRSLEEEIYELQDTFRDEQADEYVRLRKSLEQSNKNCRILSFKLRKVERKVEEMETEKTTLEKKYEEVKKVEETLKKIKGEYQNRSQKKATDFTTKVQLKKLVDEMEKEIGDMMTVFTNISDGKDVTIQETKSLDHLAKYDKLLKEHELLKEKLDHVTKELSQEREKKKGQPSGKVEDIKNTDLQNMKKKLDEAVASSEIERKAWDQEKSALFEEKEKLKSKLLSLSAEKLKVYNEVVQLKKDLEAAKSSEKEGSRMEKTINELKKELSQERDKSKKMQDDLSASTDRESKMAQSMTSVEQTKTKLDAEVKRLKKELENTKASTTTKMNDLIAELSELKKEKEKLVSQIDQEKQSKESEVSALKKKIGSLEKTGLNTKRMNELRQTFSEKILNLENELKKGQQEYNKLNDKYNELVNQKAQFESDKEELNSKLREQYTELSGCRKELETLRQNVKLKESEWRSEKALLQNRIREGELPNKNRISDLNNDISNMKKENNTLVTRLEDLRKANDDLSDKLKDYEAVTKIHQALTPDTTALESEIRKLKNALENMEKAKKADLAQCKMRYEHRISAINDEIQAIQNQLSRYKRERDTYKHMLEGAQKTIGELKSARGKQSNASSVKSDEEDEVSTTSILVLERQINSLEDDLSEARLEASRLKAELVSEKSASHVKVSELQSRINELEEERVLTSGRTKIPGLKVRMELAWQKEREEHQRLLQETATLARDLRQTLFEIERERSKERLENKRRQDQLKKLFDEEKEESKKKLLEVQCDLLELRDAHAKLRTSNEKMRREKERHEKEREELKEAILKRYKQEQVESRNINALLQQVNDLMKFFPEMNGVAENGNSGSYTPTPPRRLKGPKSRESSPMLDTKGDIRGSNSQLAERTEKLEYTIKKLMDVAKELKESKKAADEADVTRLKKLGKSNRSTSVESDPGKGVTMTRSKPRLKRKSLSLEQTSSRNEDTQRIWGTDSNMSSLQSLEGSENEMRTLTLHRDSSVDSRLSTGSTKSEMLDREKKHSKGIIKKLTTKLTKSASVDDPNISMDISHQTSGSETSINEKTEKKNLKKKLTDMFKRSSRGSSVEKKIGSTNHSRPASRNSTTSDK